MLKSPRFLILLVILLVVAGFASTKLIHSFGGGPLDWKTEWPKTDFNKTSINLSEILSGGPPKDGIPSIDKPVFASFSNANKWLKPNEPVIAVEINGVARAYPIQILIWHEIVNDEVNGIPLTITFCPLCNSSIVFDRRLDFNGKSYLLDFGTTGNLRKSDMVMYDRQTESWWQQFIGEALIGEMKGAKLKPLLSFIISYANFRESYPEGKILSKNTGYMRNYGKNPYVGYDDIDNSPFLLQNAPDKRLPPMERIINISLNGINKIYPFSLIQKEEVIHDRIGKTGLVIFHLPGTASALDKASISSSRDIGAATVFESALDNKELSFKRNGEVFKDNETSSLWNITGRAIRGPLAGKQLKPIIHGNHFAFAWLAFIPDSVIYGKEY